MELFSGGCLDLVQGFDLHVPQHFPNAFALTIDLVIAGGTDEANVLRGVAGVFPA
jgi:hypothetical protein